MKFNSLGSSNASDYAAAGKAVADSAARTFAVQRKYGPDYGELSKVAMKTQAEENIAAMNAEAKVTKAGINAVAKSADAQIQAEASLRVNKSKIKGKMAGSLAAIGLAAGGGGRSSSRDRRPRPTPPMLEATPAKPDYSSIRDRNQQMRDRWRNQGNDGGGGSTPSSGSPSPSGSSRSQITPQPYEGGAQLSQAQIKQLAIDAGWSPEDAHQVSAIAMAESSGNSRAHNPNRNTGDNSFGIMQINMIDGMGPERRSQFGIDSNEQLFDPRTNMRAARAIYESQGWGAWGAYSNGSYSQFMKR